MRRLLLLSLCFLSLFSPVWGQSSNEQDEVTIVTSVNDDAGLATAANNLKKLQAKRIELLSIIRLERERILDEAKSRDQIQTLFAEIDVLLRESARLTLARDASGQSGPVDQGRLRQLTQEIRTIQTQAIDAMLTLARKTEYTGYSSSTTFLDGQRDFPALRLHAEKVLLSQEKWIAEAEKKRAKFIEEKNKELEALDLEIVRLEKIRTDLMFATFGQVGGYLLVFALLYLLRIFSRQLLVRFGRNFSKTHQEALNLWHRWLFYVLFIGAFLVLFSSEFVTFLPFLALFGTAVAFAMRDAVFSVIGWFVIGTDSGYREADFIEFDTTVGRVFRISPLLTTIEEYGIQ